MVLAFRRQIALRAKLSNSIPVECDVTSAFDANYSPIRKWRTILDHFIVLTYWWWILIILVHLTSKADSDFTGVGHPWLPESAYHRIHIVRWHQRLGIIALLVG